MFQQKFLSFWALSAIALLGYAPAASANCNCECVAGLDGAAPTTTWACSGFLIQPAPDEGCPIETTCPVEPAPADPVAPVEVPVVDTAPAEPSQPVADNTVAEPPVSGLECRYRKVYRPDEGKFKKVKVCRLSKEEKAEKRAERRAKLAKLRAKHADKLARLRAKHEAQIAEWKAKHSHKNKKSGD